MNHGVITLNKHSISVAKTLKPHFSIDIYTMEKYLEDGLLPLDGGLKNSMETLFNKYDVLIFVMAIY